MRSAFFRSWFLVLIISLVIAACNLQASQQYPSNSVPGSTETVQSPVSSTPSQATSLTDQNPAGQISPHRIGIRTVNGIGEFYDRLTDEKFVPRGMNYIRLGWQVKSDGTQVFGHALFDPGKYDNQTVSKDMGRMHADGYNVVRVFLSPDTLGTETGGLSPSYMDNVADLLSIAKQDQIYVLFTLDWIPGGKYGEILNQDCCSTFALMNANFLPPAGLKANQVFYHDFIQELIKRNAAVEMIFSYELRNEMFFDGDQPPISMTTGVVTTANGKSYDMAKPADKQQMLDENLVFWINSMRDTILQMDPSALVSVGFFHPQLPNPSRIGDPRIAVTEPAIWQSEADFIDLHAYPGFELNLKQC
jgi:hypothetical protein